jgi:stalled ribosome rescue protein Dom34
MTSRHVAVWIDHQEAKVFHVDPSDFDASKVQAPGHHLHRHPQHTVEHEHPVDINGFFDQVCRTVENAQEILIVGPGSAKLELIKYVHKHKPALEPKIIGVETVDHPTDGQLVAHARKYFLAAGHAR